MVADHAMMIAPGERHCQDCDGGERVDGEYLIAVSWWRIERTHVRIRRGGWSWLETDFAC